MSGRQSQDQTNKLFCSKCKHWKTKISFSPNPNKRAGFHDWCKLCVKENTRRWYKKHKARAIKTSRRWNLEHPEKRMATLHRYYKQNKEKVIEKARLSRIKTTVNLWLEQIDYPPTFSRITDVCDGCGMETTPHFLYKYDGRTLCVECMSELTEFSKRPRKILIPKHECKSCGRMFPWNGKDAICIDCRVRAKRKVYQNTWALLFSGDIRRLDKTRSMDDVV